MESKIISYKKCNNKKWIILPAFHENEMLKRFTDIVEVFNSFFAINVPCYQIKIIFMEV